VEAERRISAHMLPLCSSSTVHALPETNLAPPYNPIVPACLPAGLLACLPSPSLLPHRPLPLLLTHHVAPLQRHAAPVDP